MSSGRDGYAIDGDRLWRSLMDMASIGATLRGGVCRLALSDGDRQARDLFAHWCQESGCTVSVDAIGNMFARRPGTDAQRAPVVIGSHLDTQPTGGRFDGAYGVLAALEVVRALNDHGVVTSAPIEVVNWTNEEGARFPPVMLGSGTFTGVYSVEEARASEAADGTKLGEALDAIGYAGGAPLAADRVIDTVLEAHIEQGPLLEREGLPVGVVTQAQGIAWYDIIVQGQESHAGTTPMEIRRDALVAAAEVVKAARAIAVEHGPTARLTVGDFRVFPCARNTIPGRVSLTVDMRDPDMQRLESLDELLREAASRAAEEEGVSIEVNRLSRTAPVEFDAEVLEAIRRGADRAGIGHMDMISGAGHDACHLARVAPTGLIFVPCKDGISHNEAESAEPEDLAAGCEVLYQVALERAGVVRE